MVDFAGSHVVVTGGTGALGRAVIAALRAAGAVCHVPNLVAAELDEFPYASDPGVPIPRGGARGGEGGVLRRRRRSAVFTKLFRRFGHRSTWPAALRWRPSARCRQQTLSGNSA